MLNNKDLKIIDMAEKKDRYESIISIPDLLESKKEAKKEEEVAMPEENEQETGFNEDNQYREAQEPDKLPQKAPSAMQQRVPEAVFRQENVRAWFKRAGWSGSPFTFNIIPSLFVGYREQLERVLTLIEEGHKLVLIVGPTGSGKTSMLKWIGEGFSDNFNCIYIGKPPEKPDEFIDIFSEKFKRPWYLRIFRPFMSNIKNLYQIPGFLNKRLGGKRLIIMFDEAHEANLDVLEWLRVLGDQVDNMSIIVSGLPVFDEKLNDLETFRKRIASRIELLSLTKEEMVEMIRKRIANVGGSGIEPFDSRVLDMIYERTGGFPREVLKFCDDLVNRAATLGKDRITEDFLMLDIREKPKTISLDIIEKMTPMQKEIVEMLGRKASTPGGIANAIDLKKYKSRQHAVRSINNVLKLLMSEGLVERKRSDRAFIYQLSPRIKTLVVKA